ncbi:MAG: OmpA family protein [Deltaproteobacteria bacterium]|nr:OmpA family protein [Deltaproteobacteria bacterium]
MKRYAMNCFSFFLVFFLILGISPASAPAGGEIVNLLSLQQGALPVVIPPTYGGWNAENLLDDSAETGWACETGKVKDNVFVFVLAETATLDRFEFDTASVDDDGAGAKDVLVEVSTTSQAAGFAPVLQVSLADKADGQRFQATQKTPARWVRLTIRNNHGSEKWSELFSIRGFGEKPAISIPVNISGTYTSTYAQFHVRQQGTALIGCYEYNDGVLDGTMEGRVMKMTWRESGGPDDRGLAVLVFAADGKSFRGFWWRLGDEMGAPSGHWDGEKIAAEVGGCPHWAGSVGGELKKKLSVDKRARLYGILFDLNSAVIRSESKPVLDEVLALLKSQADWKLTIEGHTDSTGAHDLNASLSAKRADSVKAYLVAGGIDASRLKTAGFGESKPVSDNASELGRAQNRRVELVRE